MRGWTRAACSGAFNQPDSADYNLWSNPRIPAGRYGDEALLALCQPSLRYLSLDGYQWGASAEGLMDGIESLGSGMTHLELTDFRCDATRQAGAHGHAVKHIGAGSSIWTQSVVKNTMMVG